VGGRRSLFFLWGNSLFSENTRRRALTPGSIYVVMWSVLESSGHSSIWESPTQARLYLQ
jgi:hypothetical protein